MVLVRGRGRLSGPDPGTAPVHPASARLRRPYRLRRTADGAQKGYATAMLPDVLPHARALGLDRVLVTCDTTNVGSRKVIEANGGEFEDERGGMLRFWIRTGH
ncbi:GNAT family N-acetyltransferase [Streptomyces phaeochromogenes]